MPKKPVILEGEARRKAWGELDRDARRRIIRTVNRGRALTDPQEAGLAVGYAVTQQNMWKRIWFAGPVFAVLLDLMKHFPPRQIGIDAIVATLSFGGISFVLWRLARTAESRNRAVVQEASTRATHLPGERPAARPRPQKRKRKKRR